MDDHHWEDFSPPGTHDGNSSLDTTGHHSACWLLSPSPQVLEQQVDFRGKDVAGVRRPPTAAEASSLGPGFKGSKAVIPLSKLKVLRADWQPPTVSPPLRFPGVAPPRFTQGEGTSSEQTPANTTLACRKGDDS